MNENNMPSISELTYELTLQQFQMNHKNIRHLMKDINVPEYIMLHRIMHNAENNSIYGNKTYMKDLADKMNFSMKKISEIIVSLRDKGLVEWSHDGDGTDGTYVTITENGKSMIDSVEQTVTGFYNKVVTKFGRENLVSMLKLMKEFDTVMSSELERNQEENTNDEYD